MTTPEPIESANPSTKTEVTPVPSLKADEGRRRVLLVVLIVLSILCCVAGYFILRYIVQPQPIPQMVPLANSSDKTAPRYKFAIGQSNVLNPTQSASGPSEVTVNGPMGVAVSPDGQRVYVTETDGDRMVKMFDRDGKFLRSFAPPLSTSNARELRYIAVSPKDGRVYVSDHTAAAIHIFSQDGDYIDSIIGPHATISELVSQKLNGPVPAGTLLAVDGLNHRVIYILPGGQTQQILSLSKTDYPWSPLGVRFDQQGDLIITDISVDHSTVNVIPAATLAGDLNKFAPEIKSFGANGSDAGQFNFPQNAMVDSKGNFYVADGNNYRIQKWSQTLNYVNFFGFGSGDGGLNLPRGIWMDSKDRLYVADAVGSLIRVYDVSGSEPAYLFSFGGLGSTEGLFSYPDDICIDGSGRLYVADRNNNRISVWTY